MIIKGRCGDARLCFVIRGRFGAGAVLVAAASGRIHPWSPHQARNCAWAAVWAGKSIHVKNNTGKTKQVIFNPGQPRDLEGVSVRLSQSKVLFSCFTGAHRRIV